jgi:DNA-binding transcriptional MerR regulator
MQLIAAELEREEPADGGPLVRIGELARRAGVPAATLRSWERRYDVLAPVRGDSGYRLYSQRDERRVRAMAELIEQGVAPAEAARRIGSEAAPPPPAPPSQEGEPAIAASLRNDLRSALLAFDEETADRVIDRAVGFLTIEALLSHLILPVLRDLGAGWAREEVTVGQEHFASNMLRGRLLGLARGWGGGGGDLALLATPSGELHDLGLIAFGLTLRGFGWRIAFLGADTPLPSMLSAAEETEPAICVLFTIVPGVLERAELELAKLGSVATLMLAGAGVPDGLCERLGAIRLAEDPVAAAASVAA